MKGIDWGRIVARLLAVWLFSASLSMIVFSWQVSTDLYDEGISWLDWGHTAAQLAIVAALWFGGIKLAPATSQSTPESEPDGRFVARALAACAGLMILTFYGIRAGVQIFGYFMQDASSPSNVSSPMLAANTIAALLGATLIAAPNLVIGRQRQ